MRLGIRVPRRSGRPRHVITHVHRDVGGSITIRFGREDAWRHDREVRLTREETHELLCQLVLELAQVNEHEARRAALRVVH